VVGHAVVPLCPARRHVQVANKNNIFYKNVDKNNAGFQEKRQFFADNWRKSPKIA
jgi:hypothetical protein